ncbi:MAG TPA: hypothetical protein PKL31_16325 [Fulvivirga sp.]|nr:hypothetical protein [Fulvivirga sp.]
MKSLIKNILILVMCGMMTVSCVTGNDDNAVLREHEEALARTPRVLNLLVNGQPKTRDTQSIWNHFMVKAGDVVSITATFNSGNGAASSTFTIFRQYYGIAHAQEDPMPVEPLTEMEFDYGAGSSEFSLSYTVPSQDDDGFDFESGNIITITFTSLNDTGGAGFQDFILEYE